MGLTLTSLLPDYRASLLDARRVFGEDDSPEQTGHLTRHLRAAAVALSLGKRPRTRQAALALAPGQAGYRDLPDDLLLPKVGMWGTAHLADPWNAPPGPLPVLTLADDDVGPVLTLSPPPTAAQIGAYGASYPFFYFAAHQLTEDEATSTLPERDRWLLILRAQVEAMRETALRNAHKPVTLRDANAGGGATRNSTPAALYEKLLQEYERAA